jgi:hypothetical protein
MHNETEHSSADMSNPIYGAFFRLALGSEVGDYAFSEWFWDLWFCALRKAAETTVDGGAEQKALAQVIPGRVTDAVRQLSDRTIELLLELNQEELYAAVFGAAGSTSVLQKHVQDGGPTGPVGPSRIGEPNGAVAPKIVEELRRKIAPKVGEVVRGVLYGQGDAFLEIEGQVKLGGAPVLNGTDVDTATGACLRHGYRQNQSTRRVTYDEATGCDRR